MKEVKFDLVLQVHDDLEKDELIDMLRKYLINIDSSNNLVQKVIGEKDSPEYFTINSMRLEEGKKNAVQNSRKDSVRKESGKVEKESDNKVSGKSKSNGKTPKGSKTRNEAEA